MLHFLCCFLCSFCFHGHHMNGQLFRISNIPKETFGGTLSLPEATIEKEYFIDAPNYRTIWNIETVQLSTELEYERLEETSEVELETEFVALTGQARSGVVLVAHKLKVKEKKIVIPNKLYILELFGFPSVSKTEAV